MKKRDLSLAFEWVINEKNRIYQSKSLAFKVKPEKLESPKGENEIWGFEVYISDDLHRKEWRPLRLFKSENLSHITRWIEHVAERLSESRLTDSSPE
jgi:hypothetical protein